MIKNNTVELIEHLATVEDLSVKFGTFLKVKNLKDLEVGARYHDIGKILLNQSILNKKETLNREDIIHIQKHPLLGYDLLKNKGYNDNVLNAVLYHHEKYDGTGYPYGLSGKEIPEIARIISLCDVWNALTFDRVYRERLSKEEALDIIKYSLGTHFDIEIGNNFIEFIQKEELG